MRAKFPYEKKAKRVGCGPGSGHGKTATRGHKGQQSRTGTGKTRRGFEGGQNPLYRRVPKRGFNQYPHVHFAVVNISTLAELKESEITPKTLLEHGIVKKQLQGIKILGDGKLDRAVKVQAHRFSAQARQKIEAAGGQAVLL